MELLLVVCIFSIILLVCWALYLLFVPNRGRSVSKTVKRYAADIEGDVQIDLLYKRKLSNISLLSRLLSSSRLFFKLDNIIQQSGVKILADQFIVLTIIVGISGWAVSNYLGRNQILSVVVSCLSLILPLCWLFYMRKQRLAKFEALFPDALDLMGYSLRAGHSIMAGIKMVAAESDEPIKSEFSRVVEEVNFGRGVDIALRGLAKRISIPEVKYFSTCIIIQRETGGNLAELLDKVSRIIRSRFRFRERVKTLAAEGKFSALILSGLPFAIALGIFIVNRDYIKVLVTDPIGPYIIAIALLLMAIGIFIMSRLVKIEM
ncbi:MAG: type II secretion system F family protein [Desulfobulbaceae bacterium]|nr:type II secretion system F family protein [Desulfobulbaceae bacterium]